MDQNNSRFHKIISRPRHDKSFDPNNKADTRRLISGFLHRFERSNNGNTPIPSPIYAIILKYYFCIKKWGKPFGSTGGSAFALSANGHISKIKIWSGSYLDAVQFYVEGTGWSRKYGGRGGGLRTLELHDGDYITSVDVNSGAWIDRITFHSKNGLTLSGGGYGGRSSDDTGGRLIDVRGRSGDFVDRLQFKWEMYE